MKLRAVSFLCLLAGAASVAAAELSHVTYKISPAQLKALSGADHILQGIQLTDNERIIYHPQQGMLTVHAGQDVQLLIKARTVQAQKQEISEKLKDAFTKMNPDKVRGYLHEVDRLLQERRYPQASSMLNLCENEIQKGLNNAASEDLERWGALKFEAEERRVVLAIKLRQPDAITSHQPDSASKKMLTVPPPPLLDNWQDKSKPFEFNGETYYNMPLPPRQ